MQLTQKTEGPSTKVILTKHNSSSPLDCIYIAVTLESPFIQFRLLYI